jgi:uncharacterized protein YjbI with pentapeptide repeats
MNEQNSKPDPNQNYAMTLKMLAQERHWEEQGQPWRKEPEIDSERQTYLEKCCADTFEKNPYHPPFQSVSLSRADIEWLLATLENGIGPIDWNDSAQYTRAGLDLRDVDLRGVDLDGLPMAKVELVDAHLEKVHAYNTHLERANLFKTHFEEVGLMHAHLQDAILVDTHLEGANLYGAHLEGAKLMGTRLEGATLANCYFDSETDLHDAIFSNPKVGAATLADIHWGGVNVAVVDWSTLSVLGDERSAAIQAAKDGKKSDKVFTIEFFKRATRAYRQLSVSLQSQGLSEDAVRFSYRGRLMQRKVWWYQRKAGNHLFSLFLDLLAGYGYKPWRSFIAYLTVIIAFATTYFFIGRTVGPVLSPLGSVVFSMTSFHGRGFFPGGIGLDDPLTVVTAFEAFVGLLIEVTFIATLTQRLFGK